MSISKFQALFQPRAQLVDQNGIPTTSYGTGFINALYQRTGAGTGIVPNVSGPLTATGATLASALGLTTDWNIITAGGAGTGVAIAAALNLQPGNDIWVFNTSGTSKNVYPPSSTVQIDALAAGAPYALASGRSRCFQCLTATLFFSYGN